MNNGTYGGAEKVEAGIYTVAIVETATEAAGIDSFFTALGGIATVTNGAGASATDYPFAVTDDGTALVSTNTGVDSSASALTLTFAKAAGMLAVAAPWGYRSREELAACGADLLPDSPTQLGKALLACR